MTKGVEVTLVVTAGNYRCIMKEVMTGLEKLEHRGRNGNKEGRQVRMVCAFLRCLLRAR